MYFQKHFYAGGLEARAFGSRRAQEACVRWTRHRLVYFLDRGDGGLRNTRKHLVSLLPLFPFSSADEQTDYNLLDKRFHFSCVPTCWHPRRYFRVCFMPTGAPYVTCGLHVNICIYLCYTHQCGPSFANHWMSRRRPSVNHVSCVERRTLAKSPMLGDRAGESGCNTSCSQP